MSGAYGQGNTNIFIFGLWTKKKKHTKKNLAIFLGQKLDYHKKFSNIWRIQLAASINPTVIIGSQTYQNIDTMTGSAPH